MFLDLFAFQSFSASISSLTLGGLLSAFILVQDQSWGQRRIGGFPCVFSGFFFFFLFSFHVVFSRTSRLPCRNFLRARSLTSYGVISTVNPYPSLAPLYQQCLSAKTHPLQAWRNCVSDIQIIFRQAVCMIMLISG